MRERGEAAVKHANALGRIRAACLEVGVTAGAGVGAGVGLPVAHEKVWAAGRGPWHSG